MWHDHAHAHAPAYPRSPAPVQPTCASAKEQIFRKFLDTGDYKRIRLFDDDASNLKALLNLQSDYSDVDFEAWKADDKGRIKKVK